MRIAVSAALLALLCAGTAHAQLAAPRKPADADPTAGLEDNAYQPAPSVVSSMTVASATAIAIEELQHFRWVAFGGAFDFAKPSDVKFDKRTLTAYHKDDAPLTFLLPLTRPRLLHCERKCYGVEFMLVWGRSTKNGYIYGGKNDEMAMRKLTDALAVLRYRSSMQLDPDYQQRFDAAVRTYRATTPKPELPEEARRFKVQAEAMVRERSFARAANLFEQALNLTPWWAEGHFNLALELAEISRFSEAAIEMKRYLALEPNAADARAAQDKVYEWELKADEGPADQDPTSAPERRIKA